MNAPLIRYRGTLAYDGTAYLGFQRQAEGLPTIQAAVESAVATVSGQQVSVIGAGRTDTGVHAVGQVIAFDVGWKHSADALMRAINAVLPDDIALQDLKAADSPDFHPRYDAVSRVYRYTLYEASQRNPLIRRCAWQVRPSLDGEAMALAAALIIGEHDFAAFGKPPQGESTVRRVLRSEWTRQPDTFGIRWTYCIEANAFLQHMVRRIVGMMVDVGRGRMALDDFRRIFQSAQLAQSVTVAPPQGLVLDRVIY